VFHVPHPHAHDLGSHCTIVPIEHLLPLVIVKPSTGVTFIATSPLFQLSLETWDECRLVHLITVLQLGFINPTCTYKRTSAPTSVASIASHLTTPHASSQSIPHQWISSLLSSPSPPTLQRLSPHPLLPSRPMAAVAQVALPAASSPRCFIFDHRKIHVSRHPHNLL